jgi:hypothetical protein
MTPEGVAAPARKRNRDETLVKALVRAHRWRRKIESGQAKSITDLAEQESVTDAYVCRLLLLTCLAPDIVEVILDGRQAKGLRLAEMLGNAQLVARAARQLAHWCAEHEGMTDPTSAGSSRSPASRRASWRRALAPQSASGLMQS